MSHLDDGLRGRDRAKRVRYLREGNKLGPSIQELSELIEKQRAAIVDGRDAELCTLFQDRAAAMERCWRDAPDA